MHGSANIYKFILNLSTEQAYNEENKGSSRAQMLDLRRKVTYPDWNEETSWGAGEMSGTKSLGGIDGWFCLIFMWWNWACDSLH